MGDLGISRSVRLQRAKAAGEAKSESVIQAEIRKAIGSLPYVRIWRNNTGQLKDRSGHTVRYGLCVGSADLIGIVGPHGRFLALEVKSERGRPTPEQEDWIAIVRKFGGVAGVVRSVDDAMALVTEAAKPWP